MIRNEGAVVQRSRGFLRLLGLMMAFALIVSACGDSADEGTATTTTQATDGEETSTTSDGSDDGDSGDAELIPVVVGNPINSPTSFDWQIAKAAGYFEEEGLDVELVYTGGSGEAMQQLLGGNIDITTTGTTSIVEPLKEGFTDVRAVFGRVYASIFAVVVLADSDIQSAEDFAGRTIGITELSGGEVPVVRGMIGGAGLSEGDVELLPVGESPALIAQALQSGQIDGFGGSEADFIALQVQTDLDLRILQAEPLLGIPSNSVVALQGWLDEDPDRAARLFRAMMKGYHWAVTNYDSALAILQELNPEHYTDEAGALTLERYIQLNQPPEGVRRGEQTADQYQRLFEFLGDVPDVDLNTIVSNEFVDFAHDFDAAEVEADAEAYLEGR